MDFPIVLFAVCPLGIAVFISYRMSNMEVTTHVESTANRIELGLILILLISSYMGIRQLDETAFWDDLLNIRQCRYYVLALFCALIVFVSYRRFLETRGGVYAVILALGATLLFYAHYLLAASFLLTLGCI